MFDQLGMSNKDGSSRDLKPNQMRKNASDMSRITSNIEQTMNPFSDDICPDYLYNIGSGKATKEETAHFLLNYQKIGSGVREAFIEECINECQQFEGRLSEQKVYTFENEGQKYIARGKENKLQEVRMERAFWEHTFPCPAKKG